MSENVAKSQSTSVHRVIDIAQKLGLDANAIPLTPNFPLLIPHHWLNKIEKGNLKDPLLLQVLPRKEELNAPESNWSKDAVGDLAATIAPGLIHKYSGRALLITTGSCALHCRYCFRKHFPYNDSPKTHQQLVQSLELVKADTSISELILSGGDPLSMSQARLEQLVDEIIKIEHIKTLRIHSRSLTTNPSISTKDLLNVFNKFKGNKVIVAHVNHPNELDEQTKEALALWKVNSWTLLNQTVFLKDVNDNATTLFNLSHKLFDQGVLPYYLNLLDRVEGVQHFEISDYKALEIYKDIQSRLPGYLCPKVVREIQGKANKTLVHIPY